MARENFANRLEKGEAIYLHETFYALMQGYDAVALQTDVQVGGTDQLFNIIVAGRKLQEALGKNRWSESSPASCPAPMASSACPNRQAISCRSTPARRICMASSCLSRILQWASICALQHAGHRMRSRHRKGDGAGKIHPRDAKMKLAHEITSIFYGDADAQKAEEVFVRRSSKKKRLKKCQNMT